MGTLGRATRNGKKVRSRRVANRQEKRPRAPDRLGLVMRAINEGVYDWNITDGTTYYSDRFTSGLGLTRSDLTSAADWYGRIHPEDRPRYDAALVAHFKGRTERFECDFRYRAKDGSWRWARQHGIATRDQRGRAVRLIGSTGDITELKRVEEALKASEERYDLAARAATEGIYEWNLDTGSLYLSDRAKAFFAISGDALTPAAWNARVHGEDFQGYRDAIAAYFKGRSTNFEHEYRIRNAAGGYSWVVDRAVAVRNKAGKVIRLVGALSDVTPRKLSEIELRRAHNDVTEALAHHTATADVLKIISRSSFDLQVVLDTVIESVTRQCGADHGWLFQREGDFFRWVASFGHGTEVHERIRAYFKDKQVPIDRGSITGRTAHEARAVQVPDVLVDPDYTWSEAQRIGGYRSALGVPLLREGNAVGVIFLAKTVPQPFSAKAIDVATTFADQAVIAIEDARLFNETKEALERQTATSEILRVISSSPTDVQPVFDAIARSAVTLCGGTLGCVFRYDGQNAHFAAHYGFSPEALENMQRRYPRAPQGLIAPILLESAVIASPDVLSDSRSANPELHRALGVRGFLGVPMLLDGRPIGAISVWRSEHGPFTDAQIALLRTFADQAVIAIENARLFNETKEALERQTATAEILKVISSTPTDVQPVFDAIVRNAVTLCDAMFASAFGYDGERLHFLATTSTTEEFLRDLKSVYPMRPDRSQISGRTILSRSVQHMEDALADPEYNRRHAIAGGWRKMLGVPLLRDGSPIGAIVAGWEQPGPISPVHEQLLKTFGDQAVIAIENVRLFNETKEALERQTATAEILKVIASSPSDVQPVFDAIAERAALLCHAKAGFVTRFDGELLHLAAFHGVAGASVDTIRAMHPMKPALGGSIAARVVHSRVPVQVPDVLADPTYAHKTAAQATGYRSVLGVPLVREGQIAGVIVVVRAEAGLFPQQQVQVLQTFADQAVIAIENVRLFNETKEALERQTATSEVLRVISGTPADPQPVFDAIAQSAARVFDAPHTAVSLVEGDLLRLKATAGRDDPRWPTLIPFDRTSSSGCALLDETIVDVPDTEAAGAPPFAQDASRAMGFRAIASAPMLREGEGIGAITVARAQPGALTDKQRQLLQTFADQAVIAIENARLFNETKEALEQQTATAEILGVIASAPSDIQPVLDAVGRNAARLCEANNAVIFRLEGDMLRQVASYGGIPTSSHPSEGLPVNRSRVTGRAVVDRQTVHVHDLAAEASEFPDGSQDAKRDGHRTTLATPLMREGTPIGAILIRRMEVRPFSDKQIALLKTFADQAVIAIGNVRLFNELQTTNSTLREALEQQTATGEILKVISASPTDVRPVFDTIVRNSVRLCEGAWGALFTFDGTMIDLGAQMMPDPEVAQMFRTSFPQPIDDRMPSAVAILKRRVVNVPDIQETDYAQDVKDRARAVGYRSVLTVPMMRGDTPIGSIAVTRCEAGAFSEPYVSLLQTFADQAVIAIENVRLFNETKEALEQQTAISEVLRVISASPIDVQPVLDAVAVRAARICDASDARIFLVDGGALRQAAGFGDVPTAVGLGGTLPLTRESVVGRAIIDQAPLHVEDFNALPLEEFPVSRKVQVHSGWRTNLSVPLLREGRALGAIVLRRMQVRPFADKQIQLVKTFADQAAIAIENVRLFNELKTTNSSLREALEQQTATSELLKVIGRSNFDLQPVFETLVENAVRLCGAERGFVFRFDGQLLRYSAGHNVSPELREFFERNPISPGRNTNAGRAAIARRTVHNHDVLSDPEYSYGGVRVDPYRTVLAVPMFRADELLGVIVIYRHEVRPFADDQIALMETFADQAAIAIENVRLFNETKEALERQTATAEILNVISSSPTDVQPVFETIARNAVALCGSVFSTVFRYDGELMHFAAANNLAPHSVATLRTRYPGPPDASLVGGRAILTGEVVRIEDIDSDPAYDRRFAAEGGWRRNMAVPMLRDGKPVGAIVVAWAEPGPIPKDQEDLLKTFADQAVIAIENVRLFKELQQRTEALTKSVSQLTALGEVGQAISSTLDLETVLKTIVSRAVQLTGLDAGAIYEYDGPTEQFHLRAAENFSEEVLEVLRSTPIRKGDGAVGGTAVARDPIQVHETQDEGYKSRFRDLIIRTGRRALLAVPLMHEEHIVGALAVHRNTPGPFPPEVVDLLKTFATQSALAIQNARLFREIAEKSRQLEIASQHKSQFLASMSHELRTPLNALLGFNEMILGDVYGEVPGDMKPPLAQMQASGKHLLRLINNVLDLAKIEAGRMELALSDYSVNDTVESVRSALHPLAAEKGVELLAAVPADIPIAYGDPGRITQCLMNLAGNSLKFTKTGKVDISVVLDDGRLRYSVADTGIGIPADKIESLFTEFKQTDATIASEYGGTGLGLSITKKFVEMHGGRIWVESEPGRGSRFNFEIPLRAQEAKAA